MKHLFVLCVTACLMAGLAYRTPASDQSLDQLIGRVDLIEKATLKNLTRPDQTHAARIEKLEKNLDQQEKSETAMGKRLAELEQDFQQMSRQINDLQKQISTRLPDPSAREIQELQRRLDAQQRELKDLASRLRRLESSK